MVADAFSRHKGSPKKALHLAVKVFSSEEEQTRLLPQLAQRLIAG